MRWRETAELRVLGRSAPLVRWRETTGSVLGTVQTPLARALRRQAAAYPQASWAELLLLATPQLLEHYLPGERVALRWQSHLKEANGTVYWMPDPGQYVIVLSPPGPDRSAERVCQTLLHEVGHIRLGHIGKGRDLASWVNRDGTINEAKISRIIQRRELAHPDRSSYVSTRERDAERWANAEFNRWKAVRR